MLKLGKKINFLVVFWVLFYILVFGFLLKNSFSYLDPDLGWHLKVGEAISKTFSVPHINIYNYTFTGRWVDHEWLINLISFEIFNNAGYLALSVMFSLVIAGALILLNLFIRKFFVKPPFGLLVFFQFFGLIAISPSLGVRMQEFGFLFLLLEFWIIKNFSETKSWKSLAWFVPLFYLWSNIHGSFLFGLGILGFWVLIKLLERLLLTSRWKQYFNSNELIELPKLKIFIIFSIISFIVTLLTPYGSELYSFMSTYANTFYLQTIGEWRSQFILPFLYWQLFYLFLLLMIACRYIYNGFFKKNIKIDLWQLSLAILFAFLAFKSKRNFPLAFIATISFLIQNLSAFFSFENGKLFILRKEFKYLLILCLSLAIIGQFINIKSINNPFNSYCSIYPCQAAEFLKKEIQYKDLNILNDYNWGGYFIWDYPEKKLFIDGRLPQAEFAGHTYLEEYYEFFKQDADFEKKLDQYDIRLVLTKTKDDKIVLKNWEKVFFSFKDSELTYPNYLRAYLDNSDKWKKIYSDSVASIYLKK